MGRRRAIRSTAALVLLLSACVSSGPHDRTSGLDPNAPACGGWHVTPTPDGGSDSRFLSGAAAASSDDVWAVGVVKPAGGGGRALTLHWDGRSWSRVTSPNVGGEDFLNDVDVTADGAWAVGINRGTDGIARTLTMRWDGRGWHVVPSPNVGPADNFLTSVSARSATDAWAVGYAVVDGSSRALALHWDGSRWSVVPTPDPPGLGESLSSVSALSVGEVWAAGSHVPNGYPTQPLILRWDGRAWEREPDPLLSGRSMSISSMVAMTAGRLVAVGGFRTLRGDGAVVLRATRDAWSVVPRPTVGHLSESFSSVAAFSGGVWAVGSYSDGGPARTLIERSTSGSWVRVDSPSVAQRDTRLFGVAALRSGEAWAVGNSSSADGRERTLILHYCPV